MRGRAVLFIVWFSGIAAAQTRGPLDLANAPVPAGAFRIAYGTDPLQFGELRVPSTPGPHPVAVVVHGGCWMAKLGNMPPNAVAIDNMRPLAAALTDAGIATSNIEYRRFRGDNGASRRHALRLHRSAVRCVAAGPGQRASTAVNA